MPVAKSREKFKDSLMGTYHFYTPDTSNMVKYVEDVANGILYKDDCSIAKVIATKIYGEPRTEFTITELK
jgi:Holliday junction resolvase RusA-like endonuclease